MITEKHFSRVDFRCILWFLMTGVPFFAGIYVLELLNTADAKWYDRESFLPTASGNIRFLGAYLNYVSYAGYHLLASIAVMVIMTFQIAKLPTELRRLVLIFYVAGLAIFAAVMYHWRFPIVGTPPIPLTTTGVLETSYGFFCRSVVYAGELTGIAPKRCFGEGVSALAWISWSQVIASFGASLMIGAFVCGLCSNLGTLTAPERGHRVEIAFRCCVLLFFNGSIGILLMMRLPIFLVGDPEIAADLAVFAHSISLFWSVEFTLALALLFGPAIYFLNQIAQRDGEDRPVFGDSSALDVLTDRKNLLRLLGLLSPVLIGLAGSIANSVFATL